MMSADDWSGLKMMAFSWKPRFLRHSVTGAVVVKQGVPLTTTSVEVLISTTIESVSKGPLRTNSAQAEYWQANKRVQIKTLIIFLNEFKRVLLLSIC